MSWNFVPNCRVNIFVNTSIPPTGSPNYSGDAQLLNPPVEFGSQWLQRLVIPTTALGEDGPDQLKPQSPNFTTIVCVDVVSSATLGTWIVSDVSPSFRNTTSGFTVDAIFLAMLSALPAQNSSLGIDWQASVLGILNNQSGEFDAMSLAIQSAIAGVTDSFTTSINGLADGTATQLSNLADNIANVAASIPPSSSIAANYSSGLVSADVASTTLIASQPNDAIYSCCLGYAVPTADGTAGSTLFSMHYTDILGNAQTIDWAMGAIPLTTTAQGFVGYELISVKAGTAVTGSSTHTGNYNSAQVEWFFKAV